MSSEPPIPEAAVEAAARSLFSQSHIGWADWSSVPSEFRDENMRYARAALTAARPLMEAETRGRVAREIRSEFPAYGSDLNADGSTNMVMDAYANGMNDAATIAERTQR